MSLIQDQINQLNSIKQEFKEVLLSKYVSVTDDTPFTEYPQLIEDNWKVESKWTPLLLNNSLSLWLDAADSSTIILDSSDNIEQWNDKSGNNNHFSQATPSYRPSYSIDNGISHNSTTGFMFLASNPVVSELAAIVIVSKWYSTTGNYRHLCIAHGALASANRLFSTSYGPQLVQNGQGWITGVATSPMSMVRYTTPQIHFFIPTALIAMDYHTGSGIVFAERSFYGEHYEIIGLSTIPDLSLRQKIEGYLAHKWGLTSDLPADHPYKNNF